MLTASRTVSLQNCLANGDAPPYSASQILQDITALQAQLGEDSNTNELQGYIWAEFLDALKEYTEQQSGSLLVPAAHGGAISDVASGRASIASDRSAAYRNSHEHISRVVPPAIHLRHLKKAPLADKEPWEVVFTTAPTPTVAVSNFVSNISFVNTRAESLKGPENAAGIHMKFSPGTKLMTMVNEKNMDDVFRSQEMLHDGNFRQPVLKVYDYGRGRTLFELRWNGIKPLCFSPNGRLLAIAAPRGRIKIVDCGQLRASDVTICCHLDEVTNAAWTSDGTMLVSMSKDGTIRLTEPQTGTAISKLEVDSWRNPTALAVAPDNKLVASVWGTSVTLWNHETGALDTYSLSSVRTREGWPMSISPDCRWLACRTDEGVDVSDLLTGMVLFTFRFISGFATDAAFSADGRYFAVTKFVPGKYRHGIGEGQLDMWEIVPSPYD
jgi:hypothetical protein